MIDTSQWRASIGAFNISTKRSVSYADNKTGCECLEFIEYEVSCTCHYFYCMVSVSILCLKCLFSNVTSNLWGH